jgi:hypothetical protein
MFDEIPRKYSIVLRDHNGEEPIVSIEAAKADYKTVLDVLNNKLPDEDKYKITYNYREYKNASGETQRYAFKGWQTPEQHRENKQEYTYSEIFKNDVNIFSFDSLEFNKNYEFYAYYKLEDYTTTATPTGYFKITSGYITLGDTYRNAI